MLLPPAVLVCLSTQALTGAHTALPAAQLRYRGSTHALRRHDPGLWNVAGWLLHLHRLALITNKLFPVCLLQSRGGEEEEEDGGGGKKKNTVCALSPVHYLRRRNNFQLKKQGSGGEQFLCCCCCCCGCRSTNVIFRPTQ